MKAKTIISFVATFIAGTALGVFISVHLYELDQTEEQNASLAFSQIMKDLPNIPHVDPILATDKRFPDALEQCEVFALAVTDRMSPPDQGKPLARFKPLGGEHTFNDGYVLLFDYATASGMSRPFLCYLDSNIKATRSRFPAQDNKQS